MEHRWPRIAQFPIAGRASVEHPHQTVRVDAGSAEMSLSLEFRQSCLARQTDVLTSVVCPMVKWHVVGQSRLIIPAKNLIRLRSANPAPAPCGSQPSDWVHLSAAKYRAAAAAAL